MQVNANKCAEKKYFLSTFTLLLWSFYGAKRTPAMSKFRERCCKEFSQCLQELLQLNFEGWGCALPLYEMYTGSNSR